MAPKKKRRTVTFEPDMDVLTELDNIKGTLGRGAVTRVINDALRAELPTVIDRTGDALKRLARERQQCRAAVDLGAESPAFHAEEPATQSPTAGRMKRSKRQ